MHFLNRHKAGGRLINIAALTVFVMISFLPTQVNRACALDGENIWCDERLEKRRVKAEDKQHRSSAPPIHAEQPYILSPEEISLYNDIKAFQEAGNWIRADQYIAKLEDLSGNQFPLMGYIKYQRLMHPTDYRSSYTELKEWMSHHHDHVDAHKIYKLAIQRRPKNYRYPQKPDPRAGLNGNIDHYTATARFSHEKTTGRSPSGNRKAAQIIREIRRRLNHGIISQSLPRIEANFEQGILTAVDRQSL